MNTIQFYRFAIRIIRGAFKVLEILVVVAEDACEKLPDPKPVLTPISHMTFTQLHGICIKL